MRTVYPSIGMPQDYTDAINQAARGLLHPSVAVTGTYSAGIADIVILVAPSGACTINLPDPRETKDSIRWVKRSNNTSHAVTVKSPTGSINGTLGSTGVALGTSGYDSRAFHSDGTNYWTV